MGTRAMGRGQAIAWAKEVPEKNQTVVCTRSKLTTPAWGPFYTIKCSRMTLQFKQGLTGLPHIEYTNNAGILGEGG